MLDERSSPRRHAQAAAAGHRDEAISALISAASRTHAGEHDYLAILRPLEYLLAKRGDVRAALTVVAYTAGHDASAWKRAKSLLPHVPPVDRAMVAAAGGHIALAADEMERAGRIAAAAILRERGAEWAKAHSLWSRLTDAVQKGDAYVEALVRFNLARCARRCGDAAQARDGIVSCVRLLEEAADHFESVGQRERAFDCFQVLIEVGRDGGAFEDVLEGYVNCIRILREDRMTHFVLDHFDAAIAAAVESGETNAAATFAGEAAAYARSLGLLAAATTHGMRQGELWCAAAKQHADRGAPPEIVAHALVAAILAFGPIGQYARVGQLYTELGLLALDAPRRAHYARAAQRYTDARDEPVETHATEGRVHRPDSGLGDVWYTDVIEWEQQGSAAEACADVMVDRRWLDLIRRKAMLARLTALAAESSSPGDSLSARTQLCGQLGQLQNYAVLSPLEKIFAGPEREVKFAALEAVQTLFYKRSFVMVRAALCDADAAVVIQATRALAALQFQHAFDPLARTYRESAAPSVRAAALAALSHIDTPESAELLLGVLEHGAASDREAARSALESASGTRFVERAREAVQHAREPLRTTLRALLTARGSAVR
jgi:hypothetical protein